MMDAFAACCEGIGATWSRSEKVRIAAEYLRSLSDDDIGLGACFLSGAPFPRAANRRMNVGGALLLSLAVKLSGWDAEVVRACARVSGDLGEALGLLARDRTHPQTVTLREVRALFDDVSRAKETARRFELIDAMLVKLTPLGVKYFVKLLSGGMRTGLLEKQVEEAVALATGASREDVRAAAVRSGDIEEVARQARRGALGAVQANLFHPIDFMLASPVVGPADVEHPEQYVAEHKFDGIRAQAHVAAGRVVLFSRGLGDVTAAFPEVASALRGLAGPVVLDGELLAVDGSRSLPFLLLQRRLSRKTPSPELQAEIPVAFVAYDLIHDREGLTFDRPFEDRRERLARIVNELNSSVIRLSPMLDVTSVDDLERLFAHARESGDEGLVLKRRGSLYEPGRRGTAWLKLKRALGTLDVVITAAEQGHGQRASLLSDYTFAVRNGSELANIGKAYSGLTDEEIRGLTKRLQAGTLEKFGRVRLVRPEIVLEVAFDTVQKSARHKSGYALRFPRIVRIRDDKFPHDIDTLERVRELYESLVNAGRIEKPNRDVTQPPPVHRTEMSDLPLFAPRKPPAS